MKRWFNRPTRFVLGLLVVVAALISRLYEFERTQWGTFWPTLAAVLGACVLPMLGGVLMLSAFGRKNER